MENKVDIKNQVNEFNDQIKVQLKEIIDRYVEIMHTKYGLSIDSSMGFRYFADYLKRLPGHGSNQINFSNSDPDDLNAIIDNAATVEEVINRNLSEDLNMNQIRCHILVMLHHHWNEDVRKKIAAVLGLKSESELKADIFGDLNKIRNDILKDRGKVNKSVTNKIIRFDDQELIIITQVIFDKIFEEIFKYFNKLYKEKTGSILYENRSLNQPAQKAHKSMKHRVIR